jgi:AcrR family transcriptional regulator
MREISEMTGVSKPAIYYHFSSKEKIYISLMEMSLNFNTRQFERLVEREMPVKQKIIELAKIRFRQVIDYPELAKFFVILMTGAEKLPFLEEILHEAAQRRQILFDLIRQGVENGEFGSSARSILATEIFVGAILHFIIKQINSAERILNDQLAEEIVEILFKGWNE